MSLILHVVTDAYPPARGGLERRTADFARYLIQAGHQVIVYICGDYADKPQTDDGCEHVMIGELRSRWDGALRMSSRTEEQRHLELVRLNALIFKAELSRRVSRKRHETHVVFSNYAIGVGILAAVVSRELALPFITLVAGTDYSRGFRNPRERIVLQEVCQAAHTVVCKSGEQAASLRAAFAPKRISVIPTSVDFVCRSHKELVTQEPLEIFADCGLSFHKGTDVLLESFLRLLEQGILVKLTMGGSVARIEQAYWRERITSVVERSRGNFEYHDYAPKADLGSFMLRASLYCSATLGEGSSAARIAALCSGIPVVTTRCGEFVSDVESGVPHIFLAEPGDAEHFSDVLSRAVDRLRCHSMEIDWAVVSKWRQRFSRQREWSAWSAVLHEFEGGR